MDGIVCHVCEVPDSSRRAVVESGLLQFSSCCLHTCLFCRETLSMPLLIPSLFHFIASGSDEKTCHSDFELCVIIFYLLSLGSARVTARFVVRVVVVVIGDFVRWKKDG